MRRILIIILFLVLLIVGGYLAFQWYRGRNITENQPAVTEAATTPTFPPVKFTEHGVSLIGELVANPEAGPQNYYLQLAVEPEADADIDISGYVFKFQLDTDQYINFKSDVQLEPNPEMQKQQWAFPIQKVQPTGRRTAKIELAGVHISPEVFKWDQPYWVARIPLVVLKPGARVTINFDPETRFLNKQNERVPLNSNWELTMTAD